MTSGYHDKSGDVLERIARLEERLSAQEKSILAAMTASEKAIAKAEMAHEKRFDSMNEFRGQLKDQATTFVTKVEYDQAHRSIDEKIDSLSKQRNNLEGREKGIGIGWAFLLGVVGIISMLINLSFVFKKG